MGWVYRYNKVNNIITTSGVVAQQINSNCILRITIRRELSTVGTAVLKYITIRLGNPPYT